MGACDLCLAHAAPFGKLASRCSLPPVLHLSDIRQRNTLRIAIHEWAGLVSYWFLGRTDAIFARASGEDRVPQATHHAASDCAGGGENGPWVQILSNNPMRGSESAIPRHPPS